jgi:membrane protein DedA with SNARE-associated domain
MSGFTGALLSFLLLYKYTALFVLVFVSTLLPIPINVFLMAAGAFASQGYFNFPISMTVAVVANVLGDCFDYFLAKRYGHAILKKLGIQIPQYIDRLNYHVKEHSGITIFITRFFGITSILTNFLSGFIDVSLVKFLSFDFLGNFISDTMILATGYFLGLNWQDFSRDSSGFSYAIIFIIIAIAIMIPLINNHRDKRRKK